MEAEQREPIILDESRCISCGICVSLCPHNALSLQDGFPRITGKCRVCGLCVASCITMALSMRAKKFTDEGLLEGFKADVAIFACRRVAEKGKEYDGLIRMLCGARLDPRLIVEAFERGAKSVVVAVCEDCRNRYGNLEARSKVELLRILLKKLGDEEDRVVLVNSLEKLPDLVSDPIKADLKIMRAVVEDRNVRTLTAKLRQITEEGNVYGEKIPRDKYISILEKTVDTAIKSAKILSAFEREAKVSEIADKTGLSLSEVIDTVLEMKRRDMISFDVEEELVLKR